MYCHFKEKLRKLWHGGTVAVPPPQELALASLIYCSYLYIILFTLNNLTVCLCVNCMHRIYCEEGKLWHREWNIEWRGFSIIYWCTRTHCFKPAWTVHNETELFNCSYHHNGNVMFVALMYVALWLKYRCLKIIWFKSFLFKKELYSYTYFPHFLKWENKMEYATFIIR